MESMTKTPRPFLVLFAIAVLAVSTPAAGRGASAVAAQDLAAQIRQQITVDGLRVHTEAIVRHQRPSGSTGEFAAIDHIVATLRADGVPTQVHSFLAYTSDPISAVVELVGNPGFRPQAITAAYSGTAASLEGDLVDLGDVNDLPDFERTTVEVLRLSTSGSAAWLDGKIALVRGLPMPEAAWVLEQMGAAGAIFVNPEDRLNELITTTVWGTPSLRNSDRNPTLPVAQVKSGAEDRLAAAAADGERARLTVQVDTKWRELRLAVARIEPPDDRQGALPASLTPYVLLGGHIDGWYHAANDEGASNAAMLEIARAFHAHCDELRRGLTVAWWPGHSNGRYAGATWFADNAYDELSVRALAYMNMDGIGQMDANRIGVTATAAMAPLARRVARARAGTDIRVATQGRNSDQAFNGIGMPLLQFNQARPASLGGYWWWHTPDDTIDKVDFDLLELGAELYVDALAELLTAPTPPIDWVGEIDVLGEQIDSASEAAGESVDFAALRTAFGRLRELAVELRDELPAQAEAGGMTDHVVMRLLRPLYRVMYTVSGEFHPDPAVDFGLLPGFRAAAILGEAEPNSDRAGFARAELIRERNRLMAAMRRSIEVAELFFAHAG